MKKAAILIQKNAKSLIAQWRFLSKKKACITLQRHLRGWKCYRQYKRKLKAIIIIQSYTRRFLAKKKYQSMLEELNHQQALNSHNSMGSSYASLDYYSMTASNSGYSLGHSLSDNSPMDSSIAENLDSMLGISEASLWNYLNPTSRARY